MVLTTLWNVLMPVSMLIDMVDPNCMFSQELEMGQQYYIYNEEYPQNYSAGRSCRWYAKSQPDSRIFLSCTEIILPKSASCNEDRLALSSSDNEDFSEAHNYCGHGSFSFLSKANILTIGLFSSKRSAGGRFLCSITSIEDDQSNSSQFNPNSPGDICDCGWRNEKRIVGGHETGVNEYPAMAALFYERRLWCGGSIISNRFILTAAHCVFGKNPNDYLVLVGDHNLAEGSDTPVSAIYRVKDYRVWEGYDNNALTGDIALVQTATSIVFFDRRVGPICLPIKYSYEKFSGQNVTILGWGQLESSGPLPDALQEVEVEALSNSQCASMMSKKKQAISLFLTPRANGISKSQLCTYAPEKDACQFDSGGPVLWMNPNNKRLFLIGIISKGLGCASDRPSINTRVTSYLSWIYEQTGEYFCSL